MAACALAAILAILYFLPTKGAFVPTEYASQGYLYFKNRFILDDGRVIRPQNQNDTVSEGQAYAMLFAAWMHDHDTFDRCYLWTEEHLSRHDTPYQDDLLAWHWKDGHVVDFCAASDADADYAYALLLAAQQWGEKSPKGATPYSVKALEVLSSILQKETARLSNGKLYFLPGDWQWDGTHYVLNPSYFAPAWYRLFFTVTQDPCWEELIASGYEVVGQFSKNLGSIQSVGLAPDWCQLNLDGSLDISKTHSSNYSWDAIRTGWRLYTDLFLYEEGRAGEFLEGLAQFYDQQRSDVGKILAGYTFGGDPIVDYENPATYLPALCAGLAFPTSSLKEYAWKKIEESAHLANPGIYFIHPDDYYGNSLCLFASFLENASSVTRKPEMALWDQQR